MKNKNYKHLSQFEMDRIEILLDARHTQKDIAKVLKRTPSTISREIKRNSLKKDGKSKVKEEYRASLARSKTKTRRKYSRYQGKKINENDDLREYIISKLKQHWNPDEISGRMKRDKKAFYASKTAIYEWLYSIWGQKYCKYLKSKQYRLKRRKNNKTKKSLIPNRIGIEMRPRGANNRTRHGHFEADAIVSGKKTGSKASLIVSQDRKTKYVQIRKVNSLKPKCFNLAIADMRNIVKINSLTLDNGIENRWYERLNIPTFFCDPYASWQKGGVEHANGMIRRFISKGSNISHYSDEYVSIVEDIINNKPRKSLNYKTSLEVMRENNLLLNNPNKKTPSRVIEKIALRG